jgi:hypothetical protein
MVVKGAEVAQLGFWREGSRFEFGQGKVILRYPMNFLGVYWWKL